jgi:hypothetical protein
MVICDEMAKLRGWLDAQGIKWEDMSEDLLHGELLSYRESWIVRTRFIVNNKESSVINGFCTYGGYMFNQEDNEGLLEEWGLFEHPVGNLTAEDVINKIKQISGEKKA